MASGGREGPRAPPGPPRAGPSRRPRPASVFRTHAGNTMDGQALSEKGTPPKGRGPRFPFSAFSAEAETIIPARGTRQIATQAGCARRDRLDGTRFGR